MKSYLSLIPISVKVHRRQDCMTIICIIFAVFLVTAIFSMADMEVRAQKIYAISDYGNWHIMLKNISDSDAEQIKARNDVAASGWYTVLNFRIEGDYYIGSKRTSICGIEKTIATDILPDSIVEGEYPQNDNEILLTENAKDSLSVRVGDSITLETPKGEKGFIVSGLEKTTAMVNSYDAVVVLMPLDSYKKFYAETTGEELKDTDKVYYVQFRENCNMRKATADIKESCHLTDEQIGQNTALLGVIGMSDDSYMFGLYTTAALLFLLVLTAGVLMIASSLNSNVAQRTEFFGMLRCLGASKKQLMQFVRMEALNWCKTAIPIGVTFGVVITWVLCAVLKSTSSQYFGDMPVFAVSIIGIASGIVMGVLTVLLAAQSPARRAAKTSPIAAVTGNASRININHSLKCRMLKVDTMLGINHATQRRKNFLLRVGSFAFSIVLLLAFSSLIAFMNHAVTPLKPYTPDLSIVCEDNSCSIDKSLADSISGMGGVKRVYGRSFVYNIPAKLDGVDTKVTLVSYENNQFNWISENGWANSETGLERVVKDTSEGYVLAVYSSDTSIHNGDTITTDLGNLTVASSVSHIPFDRLDGEEILICSEELFSRLTGNDKYTILDIQMKSSATDTDVNAIRDLSGNYLFSDRRLSNKETKGAFYSFALFVYGFLAIISLIAVFNIMNSISMSVSARIRQYGMMRAVGMSITQLTKMVKSEAVTYAVFGCIAGCIAGLPIHKLLFEKLITSHWGDQWTMPLTALAFIVLLTLFTSVAAVYSPIKRIKNMSITGVISNE